MLKDCKQDKFKWWYLGTLVNIAYDGKQAIGVKLFSFMGSLKIFHNI